METNDKRQKLVKYIQECDERMLDKVEEAVELYEKKKIVAYKVDGEALTKEKYIALIDKARAQVKAGNYISQEDLEKEMQDW